MTKKHYSLKDLIKDIPEWKLQMFRDHLYYWKQQRDLIMKIYRLSVSYNYESYHIFGEFSTQELAEQKKTDFIKFLKDELAKNPCPVTEQEVHFFRKGGGEDIEFNENRYELFTKWYYGTAANDIMGLIEGDYYIQEVELNSFKEPWIIEHLRNEPLTKL